MLVSFYLLALRRCGASPEEFRPLLYERRTLVSREEGPQARETELLQSGGLGPDGGLLERGARTETSLGRDNTASDQDNGTDQHWPWSLPTHFRCLLIILIPLLSLYQPNHPSIVFILYDRPLEPTWFKQVRVACLAPPIGLVDL